LDNLLADNLLLVVEGWKSDIRHGWLSLVSHFSISLFSCYTTLVKSFRICASVTRILKLHREVRVNLEWKVVFHIHVPQQSIELNPLEQHSLKRLRLLVELWGMCNPGLVTLKCKRRRFHKNCFYLYLVLCLIINN
jgi:hypothetical protein